MRFEYAIERLIPLWSTNPDLPGGQPYPTPALPEGHYPTLARAVRHCDGWEPGTWRVMIRTVTDWEPLKTVGTVGE